MNKLLIISITFILILTIAPFTYAEQFSVGVSPAVIRITAKPNSIVDTPIEIENTADSPVTIQVRFQQFTASETADGQIRFISNTPEFTEFSRNIAVLQDEQPVERIILAPKQKKVLALNISVPKTVQPADYYFSVIFTGNEPELNNELNNTNKTGIKGGIATNILLSIGDNLTSEAVLQKFSAPRFLQSGPVPFTVKVQNTGKHALTTSGVILIRNMFGQLIGKIDLQKMHILANTSRNLSQTDETILKTIQASRSTNNSSVTGKIYWPETFLLGPYTATLQLTIADGGQVFTRSVYFFALPLQAVIIGIVFILLVFIIIKRVNTYLSS